MSPKQPQCGNEDCRNGWLPLDEAYMVEMAAGDPYKFAVLKNTVVPCPVDLPTTYERWLHGEFEPSSSIGHRKTKRGAAATPAPTGPKEQAF